MIHASLIWLVPKVSDETVSQCLNLLLLYINSQLLCLFLSILESTEGFCQHVDTTCKKANICRTCDTFGGMGGKCTEIDYFPNATVAEYGMIDQDVDKIMAEIYTRGPVAATINAEPIVQYMGGVYTDATQDKGTNHIVSIVGWGMDEETGKKHWIVRNSWGHYW